MREELIQYVSRLFEESYGTEDMRQEILQNTLDRYDDLIKEGKTEQEAYDLAIAGIGDVSSLLHTIPDQPKEGRREAYTPIGKRICTAVAVALYILCPIPLFLLQNAVGLCLLLVMVAAGVCIQVLAGKLIENVPEPDVLSGTTRPILHTCAIALYILSPLPLFLLQNEFGLCLVLAMIAIGFAMQILAGSKEGVPAAPRKKSPLSSVVSLLVMALYLVISFRTRAWWITWIIFPLSGAIEDLLKSILGLGKGDAPGKNLFKMILSIILILCILGVLGSGILPKHSFLQPTVGSFRSSIPAGGTTAESSSFDPTGIRNVKIDWANGNVTVQSGRQEQITYTVSGSERNEKTVHKVSGDTLTIDYSSGSFVWAGWVFSKSLVVTVPEDWNGDELKIDTISGSVRLEGLDVEELDVESTSGGVTVSRLTAREASIETVSGTISLEGAMEDLKLSTTSGSGSAELTKQTRKIRTDSVSGSMRLELPKDLGYTIDFDTVSGSLNTDASVTQESKGHFRYGNGKCAISADSVSGSLSVSIR